MQTQDTTTNILLCFVINKVMRITVDYCCCAIFVFCVVGYF